MTTDTDKAAMEAARDALVPPSAFEPGTTARIMVDGQRRTFEECWKLHVAPRDAEIAALRAEREQLIRSLTAANEETLEAEAQRDALMGALTELVACKDLKAAISARASEDYQSFSVAERMTVQADYDRRKPLAWERARTLIAEIRGETVKEPK